jgi:hypothetical protein
MTLDEAIQQITERLEKRRRRKTVCMNVFTFGILLFLSLAVVLIIVEKMEKGITQAVLIPIPGIIFWGIILIGTRREIKRWIDNDTKKINRLSGVSLDRGEILFDYGFYELALDDFDMVLNNKHEESEKLGETLVRFFADYFDTCKNQLNDFPRPIPKFKNYDLYEFYRIIILRQKCLRKLGREKEVETGNDKLQTIEKIEEDNLQFTEKYWKELVNGYYD